MSATIRFGIDSSAELDLGDGVLLAECGRPRARALDSPEEAASLALAQPLDYPPLARSTTPGDRVVLALGHDVPQAAEIVGAVVHCLAQGGVDPDGVTVLQSRSDLEAGNVDLCRTLPNAWRKRISVALHEPDRRDGLAYLAATESGDPILLNRAITDADVVLPIGCMNRRKEAGRFGIHGTVYPAFSDRRTLERFRSPRALDLHDGYRRRLVEEADQVGWLLGVTFTVQVVPGPGDHILHVVAGGVEAVARRSRELYREAWSSTVPRQASLVVAAIEGGPVQQTWHNLGQAIAAAALLVEDGGAIAVCSRLSAKPGPGIQRLADAQSAPDAVRQIQRERLEDSLQVMQLVEALTRARVYLLSELDDSLPEQLDIAPIADTSELARLAARHESCILLGNAHLAMVSVEGR